MFVYQFLQSLAKTKLSEVMFYQIIASFTVVLSCEDRQKVTAIV